MQPGRVIYIKTPAGNEFGWGVIIDHKERRNRNSERTWSDQEGWMVDVLLKISNDSRSFHKGDFHKDPGTSDLVDGVLPERSDEEGRWEIVPCLFTCLTKLAQIRLFLKEKEYTEQAEKDQLGKTLEEVVRRFPDGIPIMDPMENMGITDESFKKLLRKIEVLESRLIANPLHNSPLLPDLFEQYTRKMELADQIKEKKKAIAKAHSIAKLDELKSRKRVLRRLGFINDAEVVQMKARVACEISSTEGHELVLAELLFNRFFNEMSPETCAAVLSVFIFDEKVETTPLKEELNKPYLEIQQQARVIAKVSAESKLDVNEEEYVQSLKWQLMETVYAWANGKPFGEICKMTNAYEGSLIRLFRRLEELLRQMAQAANVMGSDDLKEKFEQSLSKIRRDIVSFNSLYL